MNQGNIFFRAHKEAPSYDVRNTSSDTGLVNVPFLAWSFATLLYKICSLDVLEEVSV
jgi:hypothetical protein